MAEKRRVFYIWIHNHTDRADDDCLKVEAVSKESAEEYGRSRCRARGGCSVQSVMTPIEFLARHGMGWWSLMNKGRGVRV